jgi:hypothetical protein
VNPIGAPPGVCAFLILFASENSSSRRNCAFTAFISGHIGMETVDLFTCELHSMRLTTRGCARLWTAARAKRPEAWEGVSLCYTCPVGAGNAGEVMPTAAGAMDAIRCLCPRCRRASDRIIGGRLCISDYNRQREVRVGRDAKGNVPRLTSRIGSRAVLVTDQNGTRRQRVGDVVDFGEAVLVLARTSAWACSFARPAGAIGVPL